VDADLQIIDSAEPPHPWREFWGYFSANNGAVAGLTIVVLVLLMALLAPLIAPFSPDLTDPSVFLVPPSWQAGGSSAHWLGTDAIGRDIRVSFLARACRSRLVWRS
jgi:dipeptide transport system permease protein